MLGVLVAAADPGRRRPRLREIADLVRGGLAVRARRAVAHYRSEEWRDALTLVGLLGPLALLAGLVRYAGDVVYYMIVFLGVEEGRDWVHVLLTAPVWAACGATAVCALLGWRRSAAICALSTAALAAATTPLVAFRFGASRFPSAGFAAMALLALLSAAALTWSAGPARAQSLLGTKTVVLTVVSAVAFGCASSRGLTLGLFHATFWHTTPLAFRLASVAGFAFLLRTAAGRRACALLLVPLTPLLLDTGPLGGDAGVLYLVLTVIVPSVSAVVLIGVASYALNRVHDDAVRDAARRGHPS